MDSALKHLCAECTNKNNTFKIVILGLDPGIHVVST